MKNPPLNETPEQRKLRLERAAQELFLDIDASFGKQATKKAKVATEPKEPALTTFLKESNAIAKAMTSPTWKPIAIVHYIIRQKCECCGGTPECAGGTLVRHSHEKRHDTWDFPRPDMRDFLNLPQIVIEEETSIPLCPVCIRSGYFNQMVREELNHRALEDADCILEEWRKDRDDSGEEILIGESENE